MLLTAAVSGDTVRADKGTIDVLFANGGLGNLAPLGAITAKQFDQVFNVKATLFTVHQRRRMPR
jgi:NAD(P)-dependent dehydrogenase (short-subunit alcohol dehydrogenase family)